MDSKVDSKFILLHNWIDTNSYKTINYILNYKNIKIIYIGWLEEFKGILDLIEALIILKRRIKILFVKYMERIFI